MQTTASSLLALACTVFAAHDARASHIEASETVDEIRFTLKVAFCPEPGISRASVEEFVERVSGPAVGLWNDHDHRFIGKDGRSKRVQLSLDTQVRDECRADDHSRHTFTVRRKDRYGRRLANSRALHLGNTPSILAHELGHTWGLDEEYSRDGVTSRDNLMGTGTHQSGVEKHHLALLVYAYGDDPDRETAERRRSAYVFTRVLGEARAREHAEGNGYSVGDVQSLWTFLERNDTRVQPLRPGEERPIWNLSRRASGRPRGGAAPSAG